MDVLDLPAPPRRHPHDVARVLYASRSNVAHGIFHQLECIRDCALRHNLPAGIHTALSHQAGWFIQWKEGPELALRAVMERVARDPRHHQLQVVHSSRGPRLLHEAWSMAFVPGTESADRMEERVRRVRGALDAGRQMRPVDAWRELTAPWGLPIPAGRPRPYRISICCARGQASFEFLHALASWYRRPVEHRRYAGPEGLDVATDHVDLTSCGRLLRLVALARRSLAISLTRAFLPDYDLNLLLLSGEPDLDEGLLDRIASALHPERTRPLFLATGLGTLPQEHARLAARAAGMGLRLRTVSVGARDWRSTWRHARMLLNPGVADVHDGAPVGLPRADGMALVHGS